MGQDPSHDRPLIRPTGHLLPASGEKEQAAPAAFLFPISAKGQAALSIIPSPRLRGEGWGEGKVEQPGRGTRSVDGVVSSGRAEQNPARLFPFGPCLSYGLAP